MTRRLRIAQIFASATPNWGRSDSKLFRFFLEIARHDWLEPQRLVGLDEAEKPQARVRFTVIKPLRDLVDAVPEAASGK